MIGTVRGAPAPADQVVLPGVDLVDPDFIDLETSLPANERHSFAFDGNAQPLDHVLVSDSMSRALFGVRYDHARINSDAPETARNDPTTAFRISDHDPAIAYFAVLPPPSGPRRRAVSSTR
jgi:uncharacterized protein